MAKIKNIVVAIVCYIACTALFFVFGYFSGCAKERANYRDTREQIESVVSIGEEIRGESEQLIKLVGKFGEALDGIAGYVSSARRDGELASDEISNLAYSIGEYLEGAKINGSEDAN